jgi:hypothetical protein
MAKTIKLEDMKAAANKVFRDSKNEYVKGRQALHMFVADILMSKGDYRGFRYLEKTDLVPEYIPGLIRDANGEGQHAFPDDTRIAFL